MSTYAKLANSEANANVGRNGSNNNQAATHNQLNHSPYSSLRHKASLANAFQSDVADDAINDRRNFHSEVNV